jgi:tetratricopeptide (TPR) repeat protein
VISLRRLLFLYVLLILLIFIIQGGDIWQKVMADIRYISDNHLVAKGISDPGTICQGEIGLQNKHFPTAIFCSDDTGDYSYLLSNAERKSIILAHYANHISQLGQKQDVCNILASLQSGPLLVNQAYLSYIHQDWSGLQISLECIESYNDRLISLSPNRVAFLNNEMGKYLEQSGKFNVAFKYFGKAVSWFPELWAEPIISQARILEKYQSDKTDSINLLLFYLKGAKSQLPMFYLTRQLAIYYDEIGNSKEAYCAYSIANQLASFLSYDNAPQKWRMDIATRLVELQNQGENSQECYSIWLDIVIIKN